MRKYTYIIVSLWLLIICCFVIKNEYTLQTGKEVLLKTVPVDPRDLLRGDYVILNYEISQYPMSKNFNFNDTVYVLLRTNDKNVASIRRIVKSKPEKCLYLKGKVDHCQSIIPLFRGGKCISYGIESYFVKEGTGRELERNLRKGTLVKVSVDKNGNAKIKGFVENK